MSPSIHIDSIRFDLIRFDTALPVHPKQSTGSAATVAFLFDFIDSFEDQRVRLPSAFN
jgi:hypothetical protein